MAAAEKAQIVAESFARSESVCAVARRNGLLSTQLFAWRKARRTATSAFVPVLVEAPPAPQILEAPKRRRLRSRDGGIELEIDGVVVRVSRGAEAKTVAAVIQALKEGR